MQYLLCDSNGCNIQIIVLKPVFFVSCYKSIFNYEKGLTFQSKKCRFACQFFLSLSLRLIEGHVSFFSNK